MLKTSSSESPPSEDNPLTLGPDESEIDFSAVSTKRLVKELRNRFDGFLFITYEHSEKPGPDGSFHWKGSGTVLRGLKDCIIEEVNALIYGEGEDPTIRDLG